MEQAAISPEGVWQPKVCRLCAHRFELLITCPEDAQITLCQFCTILVEWFGQPEEALPGETPGLHAAATPVAPATVPGNAPPESAGLQAVPQPEPVVKTSKRARLREHLAGLLDQWGDLWRSSQEEE